MPEWVPDFRAALGEGKPGADPTQPDIRGALGLGDRETPNIRGVMGMPGHKANGMPDFHGILGGAGGSYTSDESMVAMISHSANPTSKDEERRNMVLDLGGDEGSVGDLSDDTGDPLKREVG